MAYSFLFDSDHRVLCCHCKGRISDAELKQFYEDAGHQVARVKPRAGIIDFREVTSIGASARTIVELAACSPAMPNPEEPRIVVAPQPHVFGLARMFQIEGQSTRPSFHVVRTLREACAILGVEQLSLKPLSGSTPARH